MPQIRGHLPDSILGEHEYTTRQYRSPSAHDHVTQLLVTSLAADDVAGFRWGERDEVRVRRGGILSGLGRPRRWGGRDCRGAVAPSSHGLTPSMESSMTNCGSCTYWKQSVLIAIASDLNNRLRIRWPNVYFILPTESGVWFNFIFAFASGLQDPSEQSGCPEPRENQYELLA